MDMDHELRPLLGSPESLSGPAHFPFCPDTMTVPFLPTHMYSIHPLPITRQLCFPFPPVGPGTKAPSTSMSESSAAQVTTFCLIGSPCCWLWKALLYCIVCGLDQDTQPMRETVRYRTKYHLPLGPTKEDSWSYGDAVGGRCLSMGYDEEASAHPSPKRREGQSCPLVYLQGTHSRIAHLGQIGSGPLRCLCSQIHSNPLVRLLTTAFSCPPLTTLPCLPPQVHVWPCAGQPVGGEEGLMQDKSYTGDFIFRHAGYPTASASGVPVKKSLHLSQGKGNQVTELLPSVL